MAEKDYSPVDSQCIIVYCWKSGEKHEIFFKSLTGLNLNVSVDRLHAVNECP